VSSANVLVQISGYETGYGHQVCVCTSLICVIRTLPVVSCTCSSSVVGVVYKRHHGAGFPVKTRTTQMGIAELDTIFFTMNDDHNNDDKKKPRPPILPDKSDSSPSSHKEEATEGSFAGAFAPFHAGVRASTKAEAKNDGSHGPPRTPATNTIDTAASSSLEEAVERHRLKDKASQKKVAGGRFREGRNKLKNDEGEDLPRIPAAATVDHATLSSRDVVVETYHGKKRSSRKNGAGGRIREGRPTDEKQPSTINRVVQLAPAVAYPGADRDAFNSCPDGAAPSAPSNGETIARNSRERRDVFDSLEAGAALPALSSGDAISLNSSIDNADVEGETQDINGRAPLPPNASGARLSLDPANAIDAFVVQDAPTEESRLAALNRLTRDAPLAEIVNVIDAEETTSSSNRSRNPSLEEQRQKLLIRGGLIFLFLMTATLVSLAGLGKLSKSTSTPSLLETMVPSGVPSVAPTSGAPSMAPTTPAPSMAPTTPAPTSDAFSVMASRIFTNPGEERPRDPTSPQWKALMWLAYEDGYNTTFSYQLVQRYALATLYYATNGEGYVMYQCAKGGRAASKYPVALLMF
jgi:hypothetical protein